MNRLPRLLLACVSAACLGLPLAVAEPIGKAKPGETTLEPKPAAVQPGGSEPAELSPPVSPSSPDANSAPAAGDESTPEADDPPAEPAARPPAGPLPPVAAMLEGEPIFVSEVTAGLRMLKNPQRPELANPDKNQAEVLRQAINRRAIVRVLQRDGSYVKPDEVKKELARAESNMKIAQKLDLPEYARRAGISVETLEADIYFRLGWPRYLQRNLSDALEGFFNKHKAKLDGTQLRASHILLRPERAGEVGKHLLVRAARIREEITSGKLTFEQAVEKYSTGPSRANGGDIGFFPRFGVMAEEFAKAAFDLKPNELSQPVLTNFGVHIFRLSDTKPGTRQWTEVIQQIRVMAELDLFTEVSKAEREKCQIEYTGLVPYINDETEELVLPKSPNKAAEKTTTGP